MLKILVLLISAAAFATACSDFDKFYNEAKDESAAKQEGVAGGQAVVAQVGARKITSGELVTSVRTLPPQQMFLYLSSTEKLTEYLQSYIDQIILAEEAQKRGFDQRADIKENLEAYKMRVLIQALGQEMEKQGASEEDLLAFYNGNVESFKRVRLSIIFIQAESTDAAAMGKAKTEAESVLKKARAGQPFETLVERFSDEPTTKAKGGDTGYVPKGRLPIDIENVIFRLAEGEISAPIEIPNGFYVVKATEAPKPAPFEEARGDIELELKKKMFLEYIETLRAGAEVQVFENALKEINLNEQAN